MTKTRDLKIKWMACDLETSCLKADCKGSGHSPGSKKKIKERTFLTGVN